ncbi:MAG: hypothetical protein SVE93_07305 [Candidatus Thermoplasmatota archaeon]|nr:hypothetical protein [Candidatus Thermoplasmatota archaeon]
MPLYLWSIVLLLSLIFAYIGTRLEKQSRAGRALWALMPLIMALPFTSLAGILLELFFGDPNITIFTALIFLMFSLIFEARIEGRKSLRVLLPFFISCIIVGAFMEISGIQKGHWGYPGFGSLAGVILFGYVLFFYFAIKFGSAIRMLVGKW